jgi:hypothetical protein
MRIENNDLRMPLRMSCFTPTIKNCMNSLIALARLDQFLLKATNGYRDMQYRLGLCRCLLDRSGTYFDKWVNFRNQFAGA